jgi:hypothetical protein
MAMAIGIGKSDAKKTCRLIILQMLVKEKGYVTKNNYS